MDQKGKRKRWKNKGSYTSHTLLSPMIINPENTLPVKEKKRFQQIHIT